MLEVVRGRDEVRAARARLRGAVGFVPTLGALHAGHESLLRRARDECHAVIASVFVNPLQFGPGEDFTRYPRDEAGDLEILEECGVDVAFLPHAEAIYPPGADTTLDVGRIATVLEGARRPGHFRGVATVVTILFGLVAPHRAYFGQKDGQQAVIVSQLVRDLALPVDVVISPTVREPDGLAMSSRNRYLPPDERAAAPVLWRALSAVADAYAAGERDGDRLRQILRSVVGQEPLARLDYVSVADATTLEEVERVEGRALASLAVRFPSARLIDCLPLGR